MTTKSIPSLSIENPRIFGVGKDDSVGTVVLTTPVAFLFEEEPHDVIVIIIIKIKILHIYALKFLYPFLCPAFLLFQVHLVPAVALYVYKYRLRGSFSSPSISIYCQKSTYCSFFELRYFQHL